MEQSILKTAYQETTVYVDTDTGEVLESPEIKKHTFIANSKEQFFLGYVRMLSLFKDISGPAIKVYAYLLEKYSPGVLLGINSAVKADIREFTGSTAKTNKVVDNALSELVKIKLLIRKQDIIGGYYINPRYAFKGSTTDRNASLKAIIELECPDC